MTVHCVEDWTPIDNSSGKGRSILTQITTQLPVLAGILTTPPDNYNDGKNPNEVIMTSGKNKNFKLHCYYSPTAKSHLVMVHFLSDGVAMKWGRKCNLGRGLPIILTPEGNFQFGFHPKFKNDQRQFNNVKEFSDTELLHIMLKYSGFLGQILPWKVGDVHYWTGVAKNSTNNQYSNDCMRMVKPFMTDELVIGLVEKNLYFCGEVISRDDITHGAIPINEGFVCTCVGRTQITENSTRYTDILNHVEMHNVCTEMGIPVPELWIVEDNPLDFAKQLADIRDTVTMSTLRLFLNETTTRCLPGTVLHEDLLGDTIEGLVMWKIKTTPQYVSEACKYKFPIYTKETFGNRAFLSSNGVERMLSLKYYEHVLSYYCDFWVTSREGRDYWSNWLFCSALNGFSFSPEASNVALHLQLSLHTDRVFNPSVDYRKDFMKEIGMPEVTQSADVIVVVGPIGCGKTTTGNKLNTMIPNSTHIDGDDLYRNLDGTNLTLSLGQERNMATLSQIATVIMSGKVPIISCGGGVLFQGYPKPSFFLKEYLLHTLGVHLNMIVYLPSDVEALEHIYNSWKVKSVINYRLDTGSWAIKGKNPDSPTARLRFIAEIQKLSTNNLKFAELLSEHGDEIVSYSPIVYPDTEAVTTLPIVLTGGELSLSTLNYGQFRVLAGITMGSNFKIAHLTLDFTNKLNNISTCNFHRLRDYVMNKIFPATIVTYKGASKKDTCSFATLDPSPELTDLLPLLVTPLRNNPFELHVTLNAGPHAPATMRSACVQYHDNPDSITIPTRKHEMMTYEGPPKLVETSITMLDLIFT